MENKVIKNEIEVTYKVKVGEHYVRTCQFGGSEMDVLRDYNLGNEQSANKH